MVKRGDQPNLGISGFPAELGLYLTVIDGQEQRSLDTQVFLQTDSRIAFVRLVMLAGG